MDLNRCNHCKQAFESVEHYQIAADEYRAHVQREGALVEDAITGRSLRVRDQLLYISTGETNGVRPPHWDGSISDVPTIADRLLTAAPRRLHGSCGAHPLLIRAGAGTGKTWASKQLVALLASAEQSDSAVKLLVLLVSVQRLARILWDEQSDGTADLITLYIEREYADNERFRQVLLQARAISALVIVIDGIDEAAGKKVLLERYILEVLVPAGGWLVVTSRPEGVVLPRYTDRFLVLSLEPLTAEQQSAVIGLQLEGETHASPCPAPELVALQHCVPPLRSLLSTFMQRLQLL